MDLNFDNEEDDIVGGEDSREEPNPTEEVIAEAQAEIMNKGDDLVDVSVMEWSLMLNGGLEQYSLIRRRRICTR